MNKEELKKKNIRNVLFGVFFLSFSYTVVSFFLPFFLKEKGLSALEIGGLFTLGIAIGSLLFAVVFSKILVRIKLKSGLVLSGILGFFKTFFLYLFPTTSGAVLNQITGEMYHHTSRISIDTTIQHNLVKKDERKTSVNWAILDSLGLILGIVLSIFLINKIGFRNSFLIFSLVSLFALLFYSRVDEKTRFKLTSKMKLPKISKNLKLILFSEIIYWMALSSSFALVVTFLVSERFSGTVLEIGILFIALYASMAITSYLTKGRLDRLNEVKTSMFGMLLLLFSAIIVILSKNFYVVVLAFLLEGIGAGIWVPSKTALQWKFTQKENREKVSGWLSGWRGLASALGPLIGGFLIVSLGINAPFYFKGIIAIISLSVYAYVLRKS